MTHRDRLVKRAVRARFVVTLHNGSAFEGLLWEVDASTLVLVDSYAVDGNATKVAVDGALYLARSEVAYMQKPEGTA